MTEAATSPEEVHTPLVRTFHGQTLSDPHAWLRAENWREVMRDPALLDPAIRRWLETENEAADAWLDQHAALRRDLVKEMRGRMKEDDSSVPSADGPFAYFTRFREGGQHPLICRRPAGAIAGETVILDGDALASGKAYFQFGDARQSPDHALYAWTADEAGSEYYTLRIRDIAAEADLTDIIEDTTGDVL